MLTATSGWVLLGQRIFWTDTSGQSWQEISPPLPPDAIVLDVEFNNSKGGWLLFGSENPDGYFFQLAHTPDNGKNWSIRPLSLFSLDFYPYPEKAEMGWFDEKSGWISIKQASGSNFSVGTLFTTVDSGTTWNRFALPIADHIHFTEPQIGWAVGGPTDDQVFFTPDGGITWQNRTPAIQESIRATAYMPSSSGEKSLLVTMRLGQQNDLDIYTFEAAYNKWLLASQFEMDVQPGMIGLSILDPDNFVATIPGTNVIVRMKNGKVDALENLDGLSASIVSLDMVSTEIGWAKSVESSCATPIPTTNRTTNRVCLSSTSLLYTANGGVSWRNIDLPYVPSDIPSLRKSDLDNVITMDTLPSTGNTNVFIGQGFDQCEIPTLSQLQTWWDHSPYKTVNLYIGGSARACANSALTSSFLSQAYQQGWNSSRHG